LARYIGGNLLVGSFFFISGFSIAQSSYRHSTKQFYKRRFWRIYPVYWLALSLALLPFLFWGSTIDLGNYQITLHSIRIILLNAFMLHMIVGGVMSSFGPAWSMGMEEVYYFFAPAIKKLPREILIALILISALYFRYKLSGTSSWSAYRHGVGIFGLLWTWLLGWAVSLYSKNNWLRLLLFVLPVSLFAHLPLANSIGLTTVVLVLSVMTCVFNIRLARGIRNICTFVGDLSFEIYMLHFPVICLLRPLTNSLNPWLYVASILAVSTVVLVFIDRPLRRRGYAGT